MNQPKTFQEALEQYAKEAQKRMEDDHAKELELKKSSAPKVGQSGGGKK